MAVSFRVTRAHGLGRSHPYYSVFVGKIPPQVTRQDLFDLFKSCGVIADLFLSDIQAGCNHTYGFVRFCNLEDAKRAVKDLHDWPIAGTQYRLRVEISDQTRELIGEPPAPQKKCKATAADLLNLDKLRQCVKRMNTANPESIDFNQLLDKIEKESNSTYMTITLPVPEPSLDISKIDELIKDRDASS